MYIPVYNTADLVVRIDQPAREPRFLPVPEAQSWIVGTSFTIQANASKNSTLKLYHNGTLLKQQSNVQSITASSSVAAEGQQQLIAEASDGTTTTRDTLNIFVAPSTSPVAALPAGVRDGINYEGGDTSVILVLRAPGKNSVTVIGDFNNWTETTAYIMNKTPDGNLFWLRLTGLAKGTDYAYQYNVDGSLKIADPYAEEILDPNNDPFISATTYPNLKAYPTGKASGIVSVLQTAAPAYTWTNNTFNRPDKRGLVIYELLVRDFVAAHDWKTLKDTLGYLKRLGINAIEIMPFNEFEGNVGWGYNPNYYFAPDKYYGTKNSLKEFIDVCHSNGIAVVMDIALNHSFGSAPMVQLYWDAAANRPAANNPWFNPEPKHPFNVGYDMNHESGDTKYFVSRVVQHWLQEYRIDGFRFDLSKGFTQVASGSNVEQWSQRDTSRIKIWKGYYDTVQNKSANAYVILEHFAENSEEKELADYGMLLWGNLNHNYSEASMGYVQNSDLDWGLFTSRNWSNPHLVTYMESHDEERLMYKNINFGNSSGSYNTKDTATALKRIELDAAFFFTLPGPKMIWQFGELGYDYSINYCTNGTINNDCRLDLKPIRWDYYNDPRRRHVYEVFQNLIRLRFHPWYKDAFMSNRVEKNLSGAFKWLKVTTDTSNLLVVGNFDVVPATGSVTVSAGTWYDYLDNSLYTATGAAQSITLQPGEFHVYVNRNVNNVTPTAVRDIPWNENGFGIRAFPNPVQASVTIDVAVPQSGNVQVQLLNAAGQHIATLKQARLIKGNHRFTFSRSDLPGAAGLYFLRMQAKGAAKTTRIFIQ
jgi:glycosidase